MSLSLSLSVSCPSVSLLLSHCLFLPFICHCFSSSPPYPHVWPALSSPPPPPVLLWPGHLVRLQWHPPVGRQSGCRSGAGGGAGRPAGGEAGVGAATWRGRLEKRRGCPQRAGQRWQGGERPLADGAEPPGRREAQLVQVSDGPMAARAVSSGLPRQGGSGTPGMPAAIPEVPSSAPGSFHPCVRLPSSLPSGTTNSHAVSHLSLQLLPPSVSYFASDQVIPFSAPGQLHFSSWVIPSSSIGCPISAIRSSPHGQQTCGCSAIGPSHPWGAGPPSACVLCHSFVTSLLQPADGSRPRG